MFSFFTAGVLVCSCLCVAASISAVFVGEHGEDVSRSPAHPDCTCSSGYTGPVTILPGSRCSVTPGRKQSAGLGSRLWWWAHGAPWSSRHGFDPAQVIRYTSGMAELSRHQKKIVDRYYTHRDTIMLTKLQELVTELYLAEAKGTHHALWKRARTAMQNLGVKPSLMDHIIDQQSPEILARNIQDWLKEAGSTKPGPPKRG